MWGCGGVGVCEGVGPLVELGVEGGQVVCADSATPPVRQLAEEEGSEGQLHQEVLVQGLGSKQNLI